MSLEIDVFADYVCPDGIRGHGIRGQVWSCVN